MQSINSLSFHELCAPPTARNKEGRGLDFGISARDFVTQRAGKLSDTYEIGEKLGSGGYGEVFACRHNGTGIERAVKIMKRSGSETTNDEVTKEFNILKELDHPNILRQIEMFSDENHFYIVTEICRGGELLEEIQAWGNFIEEDAVELMRHLLGAVKYCHSNNVAHRDLKPENILLEENKDLDSIKIIDFGLAQCVKKDTVMHDVAGSIYYIAPEVLEGSHTYKADIWSCGIIAYVLMGGYAPFDGHSDEDIKEEILSGEFDFDDDVWDSVSEQAKDFIFTLLELDPNERPTAEEALQHPWIVEGQMASSERLKFRESVNQRAMEALYNLERFNAQSKLKQATCAFIASQLVLKEEKQKIDELFRALDIQNNGKLTKEDVCTGYKEVFGKKLEKEMVEQMFKRIDYDNTGYIEYSEFIIATMNEKDLLSNQKLKHAFNMFDADGSGYISRDELVEVLSYFESVDKTLDSDVITRIIKQVDEDDDGEIDFEEFTAMMLKTAEDAVEEESKSQLNTSGMDLASHAPVAELTAEPTTEPTKTEVATVAKDPSLSSVKSQSSVKSGKKDKRASSVKACLALFEGTIANNTALGFNSQLFASKSFGNNSLSRLSARLSFGKVQKRNSQEVVRRVPTPVNASLRVSQHSLRGSTCSSHQRHNTSRVGGSSKYEELIKQNGPNTVVTSLTAKS